MAWRTWNSLSQIGDLESMFDAKKTISLLLMMHGCSCTYVALTETTMLASYNKNTRWTFIIIDLTNETWRDINIPVTDTIIIADTPLSDSKVALLGSSETTFSTLFTLDTSENVQLNAIKAASDFVMPASMISHPKHITFPRVHGTNLEGEAHAIFYPPQNSEFQAPSGTLPPVIVCVHGGPTSMTGSGLNVTDQYWTSRGYAVVWVNYGGSSGYGRAYRDSLNGQWGKHTVPRTTPQSLILEKYTN